MEFGMKLPTYKRHRCIPTGNKAERKEFEKGIQEEIAKMDLCPKKNVKGIREVLGDVSVAIKLRCVPCHREYKYPSSLRSHLMTSHLYSKKDAELEKQKAINSCYHRIRSHYRSTLSNENGGILVDNRKLVDFVKSSQLLVDKESKTDRDTISFLSKIFSRIIFYDVEHTGKRVQISSDKADCIPIWAISAHDILSSEDFDLFLHDNHMIFSKKVKSLCNMDYSALLGNNPVDSKQGLRLFLDWSIGKNPQKPVMFVAHNGKGVDFQQLIKNLEAFSVTGFSAQNHFWVDTLTFPGFSESLDKLHLKFLGEQISNHHEANQNTSNLVKTFGCYCNDQCKKEDSDDEVNTLANVFSVLENRFFSDNDARFEYINERQHLSTVKDMFSNAKKLKSFLFSIGCFGLSKKKRGDLDALLKNEVDCKNIVFFSFEEGKFQQEDVTLNSHLMLNGLMTEYSIEELGFQVSSEVVATVDTEVIVNVATGISQPDSSCGLPVCFLSSQVDTRSITTTATPTATMNDDDVEMINDRSTFSSTPDNYDVLDIKEKPREENKYKNMDFSAGGHFWNEDDENES